MLAGAVPYLPVGVHMAVVDPSRVGAARVVLRLADDRLFVGPDNGLLVPAAEACGGIRLAVELTNRAYMLDQVSHTFHGRDVFSPVAGHLAGGSTGAGTGGRCGDAGRPYSRSDSSATAPCWARSSSTSTGSATSSCPRAGTPWPTSSGPAAWPRWRALYYRYLAARCRHVRGRRARRVVLYEDSERRLSIAINRGDAAELLDLTAGSPVRIEFAPTIDA